MIEPLKAEAGLKIHAGDGWEERGFPEMLSTSRFYTAEPGDRLRLLDKRYKFNVATYTAKVEKKWIDTYDYSPNEAWVVYNNDLSGGSYRQEDYVFEGETFFRLCLRKVNGDDFGDEDINAIVAFEKRDVLRFALLTDTHYVVNGTWEHTAGTIWSAHRRRAFDGIIHLGDLTDGMLSKEICKEYANIVLNDLRALGAPVYMAIGNHDGNYFRNNPQRLTPLEQSRLYLDSDEPRYFVDNEDKRLRLLFLDSFDPEEPLRYGFSSECVRFTERTLDAMPLGWRAIVFSHVTPMARLQVWVERIRGEEELLRVLNARSGLILAYINGHQHADILCNDLEFPLITIGCAKCEYELEKKPEGAITPLRELGGASQELWDILSVDTAAGTLWFNRQGAGQDRIVKDGKAKWL